jgi:hypothetical protein
VQRSGELSVFAGPGFTGSLWATVLKDAIVAFNDLMKAEGTKLTLATMSKTPSESRRADVNREAVAAKASVDYGVAQYSKAFDGNGLQDSIVLVEMAESDTSSRTEKAFMFVPQTPHKAAKACEVGAKVRELIRDHELVHAVGLSNHDRFLEDVFCSPTELHEGSAAADDRLHPWEGWVGICRRMSCRIRR